ncbi:unnamed protein product [Effrenium voratum]|nr:unnamed protein product [Effrenium voratum]
MASLFNLQARGPDGNLAVAAELMEMLHVNLEQAEPTLKECLPGDPYAILGAMEESKVAALLRSVSRAASALEGLLCVCREGSSVQVLEAVRAPLKDVGQLGTSIFCIAAWYPQERERAPATSSYHEMIKALFSPTPPPAAAAGSWGPDDVPPEKEQPVQGKLLEAARQCFRLTAHAARQLLVVVSKQLHSRARQREVSPTISGVASDLAEVAKVYLSSAQPTDATASMRWTSDIFDLLLRMHEEQNRVAVRPLSLSAFYQVGGFELLGPILQKVGESLDLESGPAALGSALAYLEKVTSHKRFTNAPQVSLLKAEDGFIPKDPLCRSVQAESLRILLPVWRGGDLSRFPDNAARSLMKVWVHSLDGPRDIPPRPTGASGAAPPAPGPRWPDATRQSMVTSLIDMGFPREQIERRLQDIDPGTRPDIPTLIMMMDGDGSMPPAPPPPQAIPPAQPPAEDAPGVKAKTAAEFQSLVADMLQETCCRGFCSSAARCRRQFRWWQTPWPSLWQSRFSCGTAQWARTAPKPMRAQWYRLVWRLWVTPRHPTPSPAWRRSWRASCTAGTQVVAAIGTAGAQSLLEKLQTWCSMSLDFDKPSSERGYRLLHCSGSGPFAGESETLLAPPSWFTPVVVCAHQLLSKVELVKLRDGGEALETETQKTWVSLIMDIIYGFPGLDGGLTQSCLQVLTRICATSVGSSALVSYQLNPKFSASCVVAEGAVLSLQLLLRLGKQAAFQGLLQMLAALVVLLLEEGPTLQQHMETQILELFAARKEMPARDIYRQLFPLMSRNPQLFEEALKAVTQRTILSGETLSLELIPEAEKTQRAKLRGNLPPGALPVLQTLVNEIGFGVDLQFRTSYQKLHEAAGKAVEKAEEPLPADSLPPPFPLALGPNCVLCVLDSLLLRIPGLSALLLKPPLALAAEPKERSLASFW